MASQWCHGRVAATCPDTLAPSYLPSATSGVGAVAAAAEEQKRRKYSHLDRCHSFVPVATTGVFSGHHTILAGVGPSPPAGVG